MLVYSLLYTDNKSEINLADNELHIDDYFFQQERCLNSENKVVSEISVEPSETSVEYQTNKNRLGSRSHHKHPSQLPSTKLKWYQSYTMSDSYLQWDELSPQDKPPKELQFSEIQSLGAVEGQEIDVRPHIFDKKSKQFLLLDSGAQISACPPDPGDTPDPTMTLRAANGSKMKCFGTKELRVQINRKTYDIQAIKTEVKSPILGWNFVKKHRLGFEWNEFDEVCITDKKAKISAVLKYKTSGEAQSGLAAIKLRGSQSENSKEIQFELSCMQALTDEKENDNVENDIDSLPDNQYKTLLKKYPELLKLHFEEEYTKNGVQHRILTGDAKPTKAKKRNMLPGSPREVEAKKAFMKLVDLGIVEAVNSTDPNNWVSPIHFVPKPGGGLRPVGDYRDLNSKTELDQFPLPNVRSFTQQIRDARIFSKVDLCKAFHQILIDKRDRWKTCVSTPWGLYNFKRLSMGLKNSGQSFQRLIENVLKGLPDVFVYLDDILVYSKNDRDHMATLEELFKRLESAGMTLSLSKCEFGQKKLDYLGYTVSREGVRPISKKIDAINNYPIPEKPKQLLAFLGALNYYRSCLPTLPPDKNCGYTRTPAEVLAPLYQLATSDIRPTDFKRVWAGNPNVMEAFDNAKLLLQRAVTLNHPDPGAPIALSTDASKFALGASLDQFVDGVWKPLGFWSKSLKPTQQNYSTYRRELMAIMYAMRYFNELFYGRDLIVFCDHAPIIGTFKSQELQSHDPVALNAIREIGMFTSDIRHKEGKNLVVPDWLSRPAGCPIGRAYEIESKNDFEVDRFQFKMPVKGVIRPETVITHTPSGEIRHASAPSIGQIAQMSKPPINGNEPSSGENCQTSAPSVGKNCQTLAPPTGESCQTSAPPADSSRGYVHLGLKRDTEPVPPKYVPPELTLAALEQVSLQIMNPATIAEEQKTCPDVKAHRSGDLPRSVKMGVVDILGTALYCEISDPKNPRPLLPKKQRDIAVNLLHHGDHPSAKETLKRVAADYYWPGLRRDIKSFVKTCHPCQIAKQAETVNPGIGKFEVPDTRFSVIHLDIVGPLPTSHDGYKYMLTCLDRTSRWFEAYPLKQDSAAEVAAAFMQWVARFGVCDRAISDNGNAFVARLFQDVMKSFNIEVTFTPAYHAATNGAIERQHQTMKNALKAALVDMGDKHREQWTRALPWVLLGKRVQYQPFLDCSSAQLVLGRTPKLPGQLLNEPGPPLNTVETRALLDQLYKLHDRPGVKMSSQIKHNDITYTDNAPHVYIKVDKPQSLCPRFEGPYEIHSRPSRSTIEVVLGCKKDGSLRLQKYHWSSAKIAHMREGASVAQRPKLGRPSTLTSTPLAKNDLTSSQSSNVSENLSMNAPTSFLGDGAGDTNDCQQKPKQSVRHRPIRAPEEMSAANRPITATAASSVPQPANFQTAQPVFTNDMFRTRPADPTPDSNVVNSQFRPVRRTRNPNPKYIDAIWSASQDEIDMLNGMINNVRR